MSTDLLLFGDNNEVAAADPSAPLVGRVFLSAASLYSGALVTNELVGTSSSSIARPAGLTTDDLPISYSRDGAYAVVDEISQAAIYERVGISNALTRLHTLTEIDLGDLEYISAKFLLENSAVLIGGMNDSTDEMDSYLYSRSGDTFTLQSTPAGVFLSDISLDGQYALGFASSNGALGVYERTAGVYSLKQTLQATSTLKYRSASFSSDATYVAAPTANSAAPYITIYKLTNGSYTALPALSSAQRPPAACFDPTFSVDGNTLLMLTESQSTPYVAYTRVGDTFTKMTFSSYLYSLSEWAHMSDDAMYIAYVGSSQPGLVIYRRSGNSWSRLSTGDYPRDVHRAGSYLSFFTLPNS